MEFFLLKGSKIFQKNLTIFQSQHSLQIAKMVLTFNASVLEGTVPAMADLYDNIMSTINLGRDLPKQFNDYDLKSLRFISDYYRLSMQTGYFGETLSTPLLRFIIQRFNLIQNTRNEKKMTIFMGHAENLLELQAILNLTSIDCLTQKWNNKTVSSLNCMNTPDFASNLLFQVHQDEETFSYDVKVKYNGQYAYLCEKKSTVCGLDQFLNRLGKYIHNDYEKQCGVASSSNKIRLISQIDKSPSDGQINPRKLQLQTIF